MEIQLIRNATLKLRFADRTFLIDPYFADKHSQPAFAGKSKNPTVDLPISIDRILAGVDAVFISHLHPDHFDEKARQLLPKNMSIYCQPQDEQSIRSFGFTQVVALQEKAMLGDVEVHRSSGQHGSGPILAWMGSVSGFVFKHRNEKTLYWVGDSILCKEVLEVLEKFRPELIVCHAGANKFLKGVNIFGAPFEEDSAPLVMDEEQVVELCRAAPKSTVIATHLEALDHESSSRKSLADFAQHKGIGENRLVIPADGQVLNY